MGRFIKKPKAKVIRGKHSTGYRMSSPSVKRVDGNGGRRSRGNNKSFSVFVKRNYKILAVVGFVVVIAVLGVILLVGGKDTVATSDNTSSSLVDTAADTADVGEFNEEDEYTYTDVDDSILAGMAGTDESMFSNEEDVALADALLAEEGIRIGVTIGDIQTDNDELYLSNLEKVSSASEQEKLVYKVYYYNAGGNYNQQLQDVRSLIKNEVDVIIVGATDEESFDMISFMAAQKDIPVVAYDASVSTGYTVNVVADQKAWGKKYGEFVTQNLTEGNIVQILGNQESGIDNERESAMNNAFSIKPSIHTIGTAYASWQQAAANESMVKFLQGSEQIDGVITEEGMAQGVMDAFIEEGVLPKVICGDVTAGFIKTWYELLHGGVDVTPDSDDEEQTQKQIFTAQPGEFVACAQPAPSGISAVAFEIALKLAEGRTLKLGEGITYEYVVETLITQENLSKYYELVKEESDAYLVSEEISEATLELLFNPEKTE